MKKTIHCFAIVIFILTYTTLIAQTYTTGFDNSSEQAGWTEYRVGVIDPFYEWEYSTFSAHSAPNCIIHYYPVGGTEASDDWFVSPVFDFSEGGKIDTLWHSFSGFGLPMEGDTVAIYVINGSADPELASSKTMLFNYVDTNYTNDNIWKSNTDISIPNLAGESYIAIRYKTIVNWLDVRFDDISITANNTTSLNFPNTGNTVQLFPNPAKDFVTITFTEDVSIKSISLFNTLGKEIRRFNGAEKTLNLKGLENGPYLLTIQTEQGFLTRKVLIE